MSEKLDHFIIAFQKHFANRGEFTTKDVFHFFEKQDKDIPKTTIHWRIYKLKEQGIIESLGRGLYKFPDQQQSKALFVPAFTKAHQKLFSIIKKQFPLAVIGLWPVRSLHEFMVHLPAVDWTIIEVEKELDESVYSFLRENKQDVYLNPDKKTMEQSVAYDRQAFIIKSMISQSPLIQDNNIVHPCIEKIQTDLFVDKTIYNVYQGDELANIYRGVFDKYQINLLRLKRYAHRRYAWDKIKKFVKQETDRELV